jgi:hypothetical protein
MTFSQKQKCADNLHQAARNLGYDPILEVSSKSRTPLGVSLSAFNLKLTEQGRRLSVECAFQGSKVFERGGPYTDLYAATSVEAKRDQRLRASGKLTAFSFFGEVHPLQPVTAFYDWLYHRALEERAANEPGFFAQVSAYAAFSDIEFNPEKSLNCQARALALWVARRRLGRGDPPAGAASF